MLKGHTTDNTCVITDYDRTITTGEPWATTAFSVFSSCDAIPEIITEERKSLFNFYRPIEVNERMEKSIWDQHMTDWHYKAVGVFEKHLTKEMMTDVIEHAIEKTQIRSDFSWFLREAASWKIPITIFSAWVSNIIEGVLDYHSIPFNWIYGNKLAFHDNGKCIWLENEWVFIGRKDWDSIPSEIQDIGKWKTHEILLWDSLGDVLMSDSSKTTTSVGFLLSEYHTEYESYAESFDHVVKSDTGDQQILGKILSHLG